MASVSAGELDRHVTLQRRIRRDDDTTGQVLDTWQDVGKKWAKITPLTQTEILRAKQVQLDTTHTILLRWFEGLQSDYRILYLGKTYNINGIIDVDLDHVLYRLSCTETTGG